MEKSSRHKWLAGAACLLVMALLTGGCLKCSAPVGSQKFLIILQADTDRHEGMARALHALLYAKELKKAGCQVTLVFDGAGTGWARKMRDPENPLHARYLSLKEQGATEEICDYCAGAFMVKDWLRRQPATVPLTDEFEGHPSITKWIERGYQVIVL